MRCSLNALLDVRSENEHIEFKEAKNNFHFEIPEKTVAGIYERIHLKVLWQEIPHTDGRYWMR